MFGSHVPWGPSSRGGGQMNTEYFEQFYLIRDFLSNKALIFLRRRVLFCEKVLKFFEFRRYI